MGFAFADAVTSAAVSSYLTVSPLPAGPLLPLGRSSARAVYSLLHFPRDRSHRPLACILACGARTFLPGPHQPPANTRRSPTSRAYTRRRPPRATREIPNVHRSLLARSRDRRVAREQRVATPDGSALSCAREPGRPPLAAPRVSGAPRVSDRAVVCRACPGRSPSRSPGRRASRTRPRPSSRSTPTTTTTTACPTSPRPASPDAARDNEVAARHRARRFDGCRAGDRRGRRCACSRPRASCAKPPFPSPRGAPRSPSSAWPRARRARDASVTVTAGAATRRVELTVVGGERARRRQRRVATAPRRRGRLARDHHERDAPSRGDVG